ncbi:hypothetical protein T265_02445 [Opisthorchis viverrini]|uniref:DUF3719 domain-containing protein n=1 Tax=Opisthorchis viverrini TaxID=6198 RepID=A0A074ZZ41_OPIVI|nr:hypothetical protein T265_02445 [Opisthorchis viverrini]KER31252.1 hypothetical protein T265_02445 [Opisthorchis viverrini]
MSGHSQPDSLLSSNKEAKRKKTRFNWQSQRHSQSPQEVKGSEVRPPATTAPVASSSEDNGVSVLMTVGISGLGIHQPTRQPKTKGSFSSAQLGSEKGDATTATRFGTFFGSFPRNGIKRSSSIFVKRRGNNGAAAYKNPSLAQQCLRTGVVSGTNLRLARTATSTNHSDPSRLTISQSPQTEDQPTSVSGFEEETVLIEREPSKESVVSAWLLQCNNASLSLDDTEDAVKEPQYSIKNVKLFDVPEDRAQLFGSSVESAPGASESELQEVTPKRFLYPTDVTIRFADPVPSKLTESKNFVKSARFTPTTGKELRRDETQTTHFLDSHPVRTAALHSVQNAESSQSCEDDPNDHIEENANHITDWASVSSSEWGDEMCEFDRQQASRVQQMFDQIDRVLYDGCTTGWPTTEGTDTPDRSTSPAMQLQDEYNLSQLEDECQDWLQRFLHLRVVGVKVPAKDETSSICSITRSSQSPCTKADYPTPTQPVNKSNGVTGPVGYSRTGKSCSPNQDSPSIQVGLNKQLRHSETTGIHGHPSPSTASHKKPRTPTPTVEPPEAIPSCSKRSGSSDSVKRIHVSIPSHTRGSEDPDTYHEEIPTVDPSTSGPSFDKQKVTTLQKFPRTIPMSSSPLGKGAFAAPTDSVSRHAVTRSCQDTKRTTIIKQLLAEEIRKDLIVWLQEAVCCTTPPLNLNTTATGVTSENHIRHGNVRPNLHQQMHSENIVHEQSACLLGKESADPSSKVPTHHSTAARAQGSVYHQATNASELTDLLRISAKSLQHRERTVWNEAQDTGVLKVVQPLVATTMAEQHSGEPVCNIRSPVQNRLSPQPHTCFPASGAQRQISGLHCKPTTFSGRRLVHPSGMSQGEVTFCPPGSGVIGVAANLHIGGRLAPLERSRPCTNAPNNYPQLSEDPITQICPLPVHGSNSVHLGGPRNKTHHLPSANASSCAHNTVGPTPLTISVSAVVDPQHGRSCTLPPLCNTTQTLSTLAGQNAPSHAGASVGSLPSTKVQHNQYARAGAPVQTTISTTTHSNLQHALPLQHQHTPALRVTNSNLVTQQLNNSGMVNPASKRHVRCRQLSGVTQTKISNKSTSTVLSQPKTCPRYWRPHSSISLPWMVEESRINHIDRSRSTLMLPSFTVEVEHSSSKRFIHWEAGRTSEDKIRSLGDRLK